MALDTWNISSLKITESLLWHIENYSLIEKTLNVQYVLYQLLRRRGHPCDEKNFSLPKTEKCKAFYEQVCHKIFKSLGWKFS